MFSIIWTKLEKAKSSMNVSDKITVTHVINVSQKENELFRDPYAWTYKTTIAVSSVECLLMLVIVIGNALTLVAIYRTKSLQTTSNVFIAGLATTDMFIGILLPLHAINHATYDSYIRMHQNLCQSEMTVMFYFGSVALFLLSAIALDRLVAIVHPFRYRKSMTKRKAFVFVLTGYILAIPFCATIGRDWTNMTRKPCIIREVLSKTHRFAAAVLISVCFSIMSLSYVIIARVSAKQAKRIRSLQTHPDHYQYDNLKAAKMCFRITALFVICWSPLLIFELTFDNQFDDDTKHVINIISFLFAVCSSGMNSFMYAWKYENFRNAYIKLLRGR